MHYFLFSQIRLRTPPAFVAHPGWDTCPTPPIDMCRTKAGGTLHYDTRIASVRKEAYEWSTWLTRALRNCDTEGEYLIIILYFLAEILSSKNFLRGKFFDTFYWNIVRIFTLDEFFICYESRRKTTCLLPSFLHMGGGGFTTPKYGPGDECVDFQ